MAEELRALGYICPHCGKAVYGERTRFALNAAAVALVCDCGYGELTAEPEGDAFRVTVPCGVCGGEHRAEISRSAMMEGRGVGLACPSGVSSAAISGGRIRSSPPCGSWS